MNNKKLFIIVSVLAILLVGFFVFYIVHEKTYIIRNGKDFEAKCVDVYTKKGNSGTKQRNHNRIIRVYVFEVTSPSEIKGERFEKANSKYHVGRTYKGKYIIYESKGIGDLQKLAHNFSSKEKCRFYAIGGDGSFLRMIKSSNFNSKPLYVGINSGTLGFLQEVKVDELDEFIEEIAKAYGE